MAEGHDLLVFIFLAIGIFFMVIGWYIYRAKAYHLISGYRSLSEKERTQIDMDRYVKTFRNIFLMMGFLIILAYPLFSLFGLERYTSLLVVLIILLGTVYLVRKGNHYLKHKGR